MNKDADKFADGPRHITRAESANSLCKSRWIVGFSSIQEKAIQASPLIGKFQCHELEILH